MTISAERLQRIRRIELRTRRLVQNAFAGAYHSVFKGEGVVFDTVRPYQPGDDVRNIDWNVTARTDEAYIKSYSEERELTVLIALDSSASCFFGSQGQQKHDLAVELGAVLALSATSNNDKVGLLIFSDRTEIMLPPRKGRNHILRLIRELLAERGDQRGTDLSGALQTISRSFKRRSIVFLISDFLAPPEAYERDLRVVNHRHDLITVILSDLLERRWASGGLVRLEDAEVGDQQFIDAGSRVWRDAFAKRVRRFHQAREAALTGIDRIDLQTGEDFIRPLTQFFQRRARR